MAIGIYRRVAIVFGVRIWRSIRRRIRLRKGDLLDRFAGRRHLARTLPGHGETQHLPLPPTIDRYTWNCQDSAETTRPACGSKGGGHAHICRLTDCLASRCRPAGRCFPESRSGNVYTRDQARTSQSVNYGTILRVDLVTIEGTQTGMGTVAGGAMGGALGSAVEAAADGPSPPSAGNRRRHRRFSDRERGDHGAGVELESNSTTANCSSSSRRTMPCTRLATDPGDSRQPGNDSRAAVTGSGPSTAKAFACTRRLSCPRHTPAWQHWPLALPR